MGKDVRLGTYFINGGLQMTNKLMKRCSTSSVIRQLHVAATVLFHWINPSESTNPGPTRQAVCWGRCRARGALTPLLLGARDGSRTSQLGLPVSHKVKHPSALRTSHCSPGRLPKKKQNIYLHSLLQERQLKPRSGQN